MKKIIENTKENLKSITELKEFISVIQNLEQNNIVARTLFPEVNKYISSFQEKNESTLNECINITSSNKKNGVKRFDIMKSDGTIEIGLEAKDADTIKSIFKMSGDENIQILREINEYGMIVNEQQPHYCGENRTFSHQPSTLISGNELFKMLHSSNPKMMENIDENGEPIDNTQEEDVKDEKLDDLLNKWKDSFKITEEDVKTEVKNTKKSTKKSSKKSTKKSTKSKK